MEVKPTELLKVLQRAREKEPAKVEVPNAPAADEVRGRLDVVNENAEKGEEEKIRQV